jgi:hypothetical protein
VKLSAGPRGIFFPVSFRSAFSACRPLCNLHPPLE